MSLSRSKSNIPTVIGTPVNYLSDSSDYDEKSILEKKNKIEDEVNKFLKEDSEIEDFKKEEYITDKEDSYLKENKVLREETICNNNNLNHSRNDVNTTVDALIGKITLFLNYLAKIYGARSYFDIWNKLTSPKWETYVIFKVAEKALINTLERIKLIMNTACIYNKLDDEKIAEIYINQFITILKYNEDFLKKTADVLAGPFAGLELISALPNQLLKITDATNFNIMKVLEVDNTIIKEYFRYLFSEFDLKAILREDKNVHFNLLPQFNIWYNKPSIKNNIDLINKEIEKLSNWRMVRKGIVKRLPSRETLKSVYKSASRVNPRRRLSFQTRRRKVSGIEEGKKSTRKIKKRRKKKLKNLKKEYNI
jgi:hypothetical protein